MEQLYASDTMYITIGWQNDESVNRSQYLRELVARAAEESLSTFLFYTKCTTWSIMIIMVKSLSQKKSGESRSKYYNNLWDTSWNGRGAYVGYTCVTKLHSNCIKDLMLQVCSQFVLNRSTWEEVIGKTFFVFMIAILHMVNFFIHILQY